MGHLKIESTDNFEGILPVTLRVRLEPRWPGPIIAVPLSLNAYSGPEKPPSCSPRPETN